MQTKNKSFFAKQFDSNITRNQKIFDILFGIIFPILCFIFDPIIFNSNDLSPILPGYQAFFYSSFAISAFALILWYVNKNNIITSFCTGILAGAFLCSFLLGAVILPESILFFLLGGLFGFIPFFTSFVMIRNCIRSFKIIKQQVLPKIFITTIITGICLVIAVPVILQWKSSKMLSDSIETLKSDDTQKVELAVKRLKKWQWIMSSDCQLVKTYNDTSYQLSININSNDQEKAINNRFRSNIKYAFKNITGQTIERYLWD